MLLSVLLSRGQSPGSDIQGVRKASAPVSVACDEDSKSTNNGCFSWLRSLFRGSEKKDKPLSKKWISGFRLRRNKVAPAPLTQTTAPDTGKEATARVKWRPWQNKIAPAPLTQTTGERETTTVPKPVPQNTNLNLHYGLPNLGNTCYINASVQSLLTITPFMRKINSQKSIWKQSKEAALLKCLHVFQTNREALKICQKRFLLCSFKATVASKSPEFKGAGQNDAHEFFTALIGQIQSLAPMLQNVASSLGMTYKCPVQELEFSLDCRRICQTCGKGSRKREDFTNLSLDLCAETTTDKLLENYLKPTQLEYNCTCKGQVSTMSAMFSTLPNILVLHLKRYRYTRDYRLEKVHDGTSIDKDLVLSTENTAARFSLVGVISHLGDNAKSGHYIFEGRSPDHDLNNQGDGWLCYNDSQVFKSSRSDVCKNRQRSAYILFYQRTCGTKSTGRK